MSHPAASSIDSDGSAIFDAYLALRIATNADLQGTIRCPEVIEICAALVCPDHRGIVAEFHAAVKPARNALLHPTALSKVCLTQEQIDASPPFAVAFAELHKWLAAAGFGDVPPSRSYCVVVVGGTDLARALKHQAQSDAEVDAPTAAHVSAAFTRWASVYPLFVRIANKKAKRLDDMLPKLAAALTPQVSDTIDAKFATVTAAAKARSPGALETVTGAKVLAMMMHLGARPDFTTAPDVAQGFKHWRAFEDGHCCCTQDSAEVRDKLLLPTVTSAAAATAAHGAEDDDDDGAASSDGSSGNRPHGGGPPKQRGSLLHVPLARVPRDPIQDILLVESVRATMLPAEFRALIRKMNVFLRVDALKCGLDMTIDGYVLLDAMLAHPRFRQVKKAPVAMICLENEKNRFSFVYGKDGRMYIRANHAHAFPEIDVNLTPVAIGDPIRYAIHGTNLKHWPSIQRDGLNRMARRFVVMKHHHAVTSAAPPAEGEDPPPQPLDATTLEAAADFGLRRHSTCFICVNVQALLREGVPVYVNANRAIVSPGLDGVIPRRFFAGAVDIDGNDLMASAEGPIIA